VKHYRFFVVFLIDIVSRETIFFIDVSRETIFLSMFHVKHSIFELTLFLVKQFL